MYKLPFTMKTIAVCIFISLFYYLSKSNQCNLITAIIKHKEVEYFLHPEAKGRDTLYIQKTEICREYNKKVNGIQVIAVNRKEWQTKHNRLELSQVKENGELKRVNMYYLPEHVVFIAYLDELGNLKNINAFEK